MAVSGLAACSSGSAGTEAEETPQITEAAPEPTEASTTTAAPATKESPTTQAPTTTAAPETTAPPNASIDPATDQGAAKDALLVLSDFPAGWSEVPNAEPTDEEADYRRRTAECIGSDRRIGDLGGATASTGDFTSPSEETVAENVSFAPSVAEPEDLIARFAAPGRGRVLRRSHS